MHNGGTHDNSRIELLGLSSAKFFLNLDEISSSIPPKKPYKKVNLQENLKIGITASSYIFLFKYGGRKEGVRNHQLLPQKKRNTKMKVWQANHWRIWLYLKVMHAWKTIKNEDCLFNDSSIDAYLLSLEMGWRRRL